MEVATNVFALLIKSQYYTIMGLILGRLGGVVVSVLATGPKGCAGSKPGQGDEFLRAIKIRSTPLSRMGSKEGRSHVVRFYGT
jgi:hypothetical protein